MGDGGAEWDYLPQLPILENPAVLTSGQAGMFRDPVVLIWWTRPRCVEPPVYEALSIIYHGGSRAGGVYGAYYKLWCLIHQD